MSESPSLKASVQEGLKAARANLLPAIFLQVLALGLVLSYYFVPAASSALERLGAYKTETGFIFGMISTGLCGGILPFLIARLLARPGEQQAWKLGLFYTLFWAYKGFEVELLYRVLAAVYGTDHQISTILCKVVTDQLFYCPIFAVPLSVFAYSWGGHGFSLGKAWRDFREPGWYSRRVLTPLISNMGIWLPATAIIYALPTPLQLPLQNIVLVFFTLVFAHVTRTANR